MNVVTMKREAISAATEADPSKAFFAVRDIHAYYGESYIVQGVTLGVRKDNPSFLRWLDLFASTYVSSGRYDETYRKWWGTEAPKLNAVW